jgi:hypothetical protein
MSFQKTPKSVVDTSERLLLIWAAPEKGHYSTALLAGGVATYQYIITYDKIKVGTGQLFPQLRNIACMDAGKKPWNLPIPEPFLLSFGGAWICFGLASRTDLETGKES